MAALDLLGRRWALRIIWELRGDDLSFRALQSRGGAISPSVLNQRLSELRAAGIVASDRASGYRLSAAGRRLLSALAPLNEWAAGWARRRRALRTKPRRLPRRSKPARSRPRS